MTLPVVLRLTPSDLAIVKRVARARDADNLRHGRAPRYGGKPAGQGLFESAIGAAGELALAQFFGIPWEPDVSFARPYDGDIGREEVRTTTYRGGCLIVHPADPDDRRFWLVTGMPPEVTIRGWILGCDAKRREWWHAPQVGRPAYFVPQHALITALPSSKGS